MMSSRDKVLEPPEKKLKTDGGRPVASPTQCGVIDATKTFEEKEKGDVVVSVEGFEIKVHSVLLGLASPVFAALLCNPTREGIERKIELPDKSKDEFLLFMSFLRPGSGRRVDKDNVDTLLPWFDHYAVSALKAECETVLLTLPVTVARLVEAHKMRLDKQYERCLVELPPKEFKVSFQELVEESDVLQDLVRKNKKVFLRAGQQRFSGPFNAEMQRFASFLDQLFSNDKDIKAARPILFVCLRNVDLLEDDICSKIVQMPWNAPESVQVGIDLLTLFLDKKRNEKQKMQALMKTRVAALATGVYQALPSTGGVDDKVRKLILQLTADW